MSQHTFEHIIANLSELTEKDFDDRIPDSDGYQRLCELTEQLMSLPHPERGIRALFDIMERLPDSDLGTPGPLVHTLEKLDGYESGLSESIRRNPTPLAVWMVNRVLNGTKVPGRRAFYLDLLRLAMDNPNAPEDAKEQAAHFIEYQAGVV